jgi:putative Mg2+ transporter-C (MgtC) family protein
MNPFFDELLGGLRELDDLARVAARLVAATLVGAIAGVQRERVGKSAGLRTHMLVALGSAMFVLVPLQIGMSSDGIARVIQGVAAGIGFIGGGAILKLAQDREVHGLTTAAGIWMTAAAGVAIGLGAIGLGLVAMALTWVILALLRHVEARIQKTGGLRDG